MFEWVSKSLDFIEKYSWIALVTIALVLFIPEEQATQMKIAEIRDSYLGLLWIGLIVSCLLTIAGLAKFVRKEIFEDWRRTRANLREARESEKKRQKAIDRTLGSLTGHEQLWLYYCLYYYVQTMTAPALSKTANSLTNKGILVQGSGNVSELPWHVRGDVWEYLLEVREDFLPEDYETDPQFKQAIDSFADRVTDIYDRI